jgi:hypothetical protein
MTTKKALQLLLLLQLMMMMMMMMMITVTIQWRVIFIGQDGSNFEQIIFVTDHHFDIQSREKFQAILLLVFYVYHKLYAQYCTADSRCLLHKHAAF